MPEMDHDEVMPKPVAEKAKQKVKDIPDSVKETVETAKEKVAGAIDEEKVKAVRDEFERRRKETTTQEQMMGLLFLITVGVGVIAVSNVRNARFVRNVVKKQAKNVALSRAAIEECFENGHPFYHFAGLGVYIPKTS